MKQIEEHYDVVVCGGGLAGLSAAVAAAREGVRTCLIQDRPVLGGNSSSEIRVTPHGAAACHAYARETGILSELLIEERARNHQETMETGGMNSVWDMVLYDLAVSTPNLSLHLNTSILNVVMHGAQNGSAPVGASEPAHIQHGYYHRPACNTSNRIAAVRCQVNHAELDLLIGAKIFIDASGDGIVADLAGCEWRMGAESRDEFNEPHGLDQASTGVMGNSIHFRTRDTGRPCAYRPPSWAVEHRDAKYFQCHKRSYQDARGGFWWFEISAPWHTIYDSEKIRHELTRHVLGIWDWMKNRDPEMKEKLVNHAIDWIGQVPGKRESRRIMGRYLLTENDALEKRAFEDEIAYGGWYVDLHHPGGLLLDGSEGEVPEEHYNPRVNCGPYRIPLRMLISKDLDNLLMAGRNISATHVGLGTVRVMGTTALTGQAAGVTAAVAVGQECEVPAVAQQYMQQVQQTLLRAGCFLLSAKNEDVKDLALQAQARASSEASFELVEPCYSQDSALQQYWMSADRIRQLRSQWIAISTPQLESVGLYLTNQEASSQKLRLRLVQAEHIWDYPFDGDLNILAEVHLNVPANHHGWLDWPCHVQTTGSCAYVRLDVMSNDALVWHTAAHTIPGFPAAFEFQPGQMQRWREACTNAIRVVPAQSVWPAASVLSGVTRPYRATNVWRSDAAETLPQSLELVWDDEICCSRVELTFPGNILLEHHKYPPFWCDPQLPTEYELQCWDGGAWRCVLQVTGNYQRQRIHRFDATITTRRLRVVVTRTGGDPSAAITEIRCYA
ncbi:FAD-dependent oxidoreductase [Coraliomargarita algicola]|uniref:FAD-dependent oxidoreductase n=1 Tax=Coraliomargarita algicola TaxID=3092156 RepID=A0ABZ0RL45_9BACT|nr:FAD-dependent oxidoreductase [Coraliomargarita sp. J2-16]WPJ95803.1 FAD-dependent oxidoreductase [Coraliomargarita sp. J2-16]